MQGRIAIVEKDSEEHPWQRYYRTGESILPPEHEMRCKQIDIIARLADSVGILPELYLYDPNNCGMNDNE